MLSTLRSTYPFQSLFTSSLNLVCFVLLAVTAFYNGLLTWRFCPGCTWSGRTKSSSSLISLVTSFLSHELFRSVLFVNYLGSLSNLFYDQIFITSIFINLLILVVKHMFSWWMFHVHLKIYILKLLNIVFFESAFNQLCRLCFSSCSKYSNILSSCFISYQEYNVENALLLLHNYLLIF